MRNKTNIYIYIYICKGGIGATNISTYNTEKGGKVFTY